MNAPVASTASSTFDLRFGFGCAIAAHTLWGLFPIFWRQLNHIDAMELVWHRVLWSFVLLTIIIPLLLRKGNLGGFREFANALGNPRVWAIYSLAAGLIAINWFTFIWAVNNHRVLEASLGYYINPLLNVTLGVLVLGERLGRIQWCAVMVAAVGVLVMSIAGGGVPWISLTMASSFAFYALIKAKAGLPAVLGLWFEMAVLFLPALFFISSKVMVGESALDGSPLTVKAMLVSAGLVTISPLLLFAAAVRRVSLSTIGILQYIGPTLQFVVGAFVFGEALDQWRIIGFAFVWAGLVIYLLSPTIRRRFGPHPVPCTSN
ncbi:EamA-like transporter family protein [Novipirellula galeiformis]|uniref:EamA-like transporter family protein n=1 Tax=Novipirellula galeiformis TaxID=2528004 RepID=A0A5C6C303_9BACT|nr:EamA family transporter RarD [Novipirellula galeiformis]TWU17634.1 EamA-like transporter family protein [Novipirellula galeiformis]